MISPVERDFKRHQSEEHNVPMRQAAAKNHRAKLRKWKSTISAIAERIHAAVM